jgi:hypothetical protein
MDKIVDFKDEVTINVDTILKRLQSVQSEIAQDFVEIMDQYAENVLLKRSIVSLSGKTQVCRFLLEGLTPYVLEQMDKISLHLASKDVENRIDQIVEAGFDLKLPTPEGISRAKKLFGLLKPISTEEEAQRLADLSKHLRMIALTLSLLCLGDESDSWILDRLAQLSKSDVKTWTNLVHALVVNNNEKE